MIVRIPNPEDKSAIIGLLQLSLGEAKLKKSEEIWNFKHEKNPFGVSPVLVAEESDTLIGVRAFMQWRWQLENEILVSYRAVDTATHPDYQGRGIFKTLTLKALDYIHEKGDCFVFNTPNEQSRPGYLKMGWKEVGKINVALVCTFFYLYKLFQSNSKNKNKATESQIEYLCDLHNKKLQSDKVIFTPKSASYLKWRYEENLLQEYHVISTADYYIAMYVKKHRFYKELRIVEVIAPNKLMTSEIKALIIKYAFKNRCLLISLDDDKMFKFRFFGAFGPILTFKSVTSNTDFVQKALNIANWKYSIGDLELF